MIEGSPADEDSEPTPIEGPDQAVGPSTSPHVDDIQEDVDMAIATTAELTPWVTSQGGPQFDIETSPAVVPWSMLPDQSAQQPTSVGDQRSSVGVEPMDVDENYAPVSPWTLLPEGGERSALTSPAASGPTEPPDTRVPGGAYQQQFSYEIIWCNHNCRISCQPGCHTMDPEVDPRVGNRTIIEQSGTERD